MLNSGNWRLHDEKKISGADVSKTTRPLRTRAKTAAEKTAAAKVAFIECMECVSVKKLPDGPEWSYEVKLDGYRLVAVRNEADPILFSRRANILNARFPTIAAGLAKLPKETVIDGEVVALDDQGGASFQSLQNFKTARIHYYAFDILVLERRSLLHLPLEERRAILNEVLPRNQDITTSVVVHGPAIRILKFVQDNGLEGVIAKRSDSIYEPGKRSGLWCKHRIDQGQDFVVGGYTPDANGFDSLIVGFYRGKDLMFAARVRAGFVPATRRQVFTKLQPYKVPTCPFANLPDTTAGRFGEGLTAEKMAGCIWLKPEVVVLIDFAEWTGADRLRHAAFVALRDDKEPRKVVKEER
jgi:DNA ligase D-like protein (predicted ligase)